VAKLARNSDVDDRCATRTRGRACCSLPHCRYQPSSSTSIPNHPIYHISPHSMSSRPVSRFIFAWRRIYHVHSKREPAALFLSLSSGMYSVYFRSTVPKSSRGDLQYRSHRHAIHASPQDKLSATGVSHLLGGYIKNAVLSSVVGW
jgi:hypothetical protein